MRLVAEPLTPESFAPFGDVISCNRTDVAPVSANLGTADRRNFLVDLANPRPSARLNLATFRCRPLAEPPLVLGILEKHPASAQVFVPMSPARYLVVVAPGGDAPELTHARAFIAEGAQGIAYAPGVWHHPMIALGSSVDFSCLVWEDGTAEDCITVDLPERLEIEV